MMIYKGLHECVQEATADGAEDDAISVDTVVYADAVQLLLLEQRSLANQEQVGKPQPCPSGDLK